jgi:hypothetical protein
MVPILLHVRDPIRIYEGSFIDRKFIQMDSHCSVKD